MQVKSSMKLQNVFRRVSQVSRGASDTVDGEDKEKKVKWFLKSPHHGFKCQYTRWADCLAGPLPTYVVATAERSSHQRWPRCWSNSSRRGRRPSASSDAVPMCGWWGTCASAWTRGRRSTGPRSLSSWPPPCSRTCSGPCQTACSCPRTTRRGRRRPPPTRRRRTSTRSRAWWRGCPLPTITSWDTSSTSSTRLQKTTRWIYVEVKQEGRCGVFQRNVGSLLLRASTF